MHYLLLHLALLTGGAYSLIVGAVPLTIPLNLDGSYVDGGSFVVFISDTTYASSIQRGVSTAITSRLAIPP
jgi:hypothetical protein